MSRISESFLQALGESAFAQNQPARRASGRTYSSSRTQSSAFFKYKLMAQHLSLSRKAERSPQPLSPVASLEYRKLSPAITAGLYIIRTGRSPNPQLSSTQRHSLAAPLPRRDKKALSATVRQSVECPLLVSSFNTEAPQSLGPFDKYFKCHRRLSPGPTGSKSAMNTSSATHSPLRKSLFYGLS